MTSLQTEFKQLFRACWEGESPWEVLADWVLELGTVPELSTLYLYNPVDGYWVYFKVFEPLGMPGHFGFHLAENELGIGEPRHLPPDRFASEFPKLMEKDVDFLFYVLSK